MRAGFALVFSILLLLAFSVLASGMLAVGSREAWVAEATVRKAWADRTAEAAVLAAFSGWSTRAVADLPMGDHRTVPTSVGNATVRVTRLDTGLFLLRAEARLPSPAGAASGKAGLLVRAVVPERVGAAFPAALTAGSGVELSGGTVTAPSDRAACDDPLPGVFAPDVLVGPGAVVAGEPPVRRESPSPPPAPDLLGSALAPSMATVRNDRATVNPEPIAAGDECIPDARNWGSVDPDHPCFTLRPVVLTGTTWITGGEGRGVLVVEGDLRITDGTFEGLILVRGHLTVEGGVLKGAVRAGSATVTGGTVVRDGCSVEAALQTHALDRAFRPPGRWWVPIR